MFMCELLEVQWDFGVWILLSQILDEEKSWEEQGYDMKNDASVSLGLVQHSVPLTHLNF